MIKRLLILCAMLCAVCAAPATLAEGEPFSVDAERVYAGMDRPYAQGYAPTEAGDSLTVVLPLLSEAQGDITATLEPADQAGAPFRLRGLTKVVKRSDYRFGAEKVGAHLVTFRLKLYPSRLNGEYPFTISVAGRDRAGNALAARFDLEATIAGGRDDPEPPRAAIEGFGIGGGLIAGERDALRFTIRNQSANRALEHLSVRVADASGDVLPLGADVLALGRLAAGASIECEAPVLVAQKAAAQPHAVELTLSYGYGGGKQATETVKYTVEVRQPVRFSHGDVALPARVTQGDVASISVNLMNLGKSQIRNALLTVDMPGLSPGGGVLAGTIEPGESKPASANLRADGEAGPVEGEARISYEDAYGEVHELSLPLKTTIEKKVAPAFTAAGKAQPEDAQANRWVPYAACGMLAALLVAQGALLRRKIRALEEKRL
ncbi:MAG: hypothetical protein GX558_04885 [Clostridiales bacterium]|nr:hypothetical protein [Clostridiales bacterium]